MTVPLWFLDFDGVVHAFTRKVDPNVWGPPDNWIFTQAVPHRRVYNIRTAVPVRDFIRLIHETEAAEIVWHTDWQHDVLPVAEKLGLPRFPVCDAPEFLAWTDDAAGWWKLPAVERAIAAGRRVLWTDDDLDSRLQGMTQRQFAEIDQLDTTCLIAPSGNTGLTHRHIRTIGAFLGVEVMPRKARV